MIVLDTNVISELMRSEPELGVVTWLDSVRESEVWTTSVVIAEISAGIALLPAGARRTRLADALDAAVALFGERVLTLSVAASYEYGRIVASRSRSGRPISIADGLIAAATSAAGGTLATRNTRDFEGLDVTVLNPWEAPGID